MEKETLALINKLFYFARADAETELNYLNELLDKASYNTKEITEQQLKGIEAKKEYLNLISRCYKDFKGYVKERN